MKKQQYSIGPFIFLTFVYFLVGFLTTINGQFQGPLKIAFLSDAGEMKNTFTTLISFFFFLGYLLNSRVAGRWIDSHGYKTTMLRALGCMIGGLLLYDLAAYAVVDFSDIRIEWAAGSIPWGYVIFLIGSFLMGTSAAILQVVINPYVSAYDLPGTRPAQRLNIVTAVNSFGTTIAPFFVTLVIFSGVSWINIFINTGNWVFGVNSTIAKPSAPQNLAINITPFSEVSKIFHPKSLRNCAQNPSRVLSKDICSKVNSCS